MLLCTRLLTDSEELRANLSAIMKNFKVSLSSVLSYHIPVQEQQRTKTKRAQYGDKSALRENYLGLCAISRGLRENGLREFKDR